MTVKQPLGGVLAPFWRYKKSFVTFLIFVAYAGAVFWSNYDSLQQLQRDALVKFQLETENQAAAISYYFSERQNDIFELAGSEPIFSFFKNRDLGMSYQYGLGMNVQAIEERFEKIVRRKRVGEQAVYTGIVLIDNVGAPIAHWNKASLAEDYKTWLSPDNHETRVSLPEKNGEVLISAPVWINQRYRGELLAWTNANTSLAQFGRTRPEWHHLLVNRQNAAALGMERLSSQVSSRLQRALKKPTSLESGAKIDFGGRGQKALVIAKVDIAQTPLAFVSATSEYPTEHGSARLFLLAVGIIPFVVLLVAFLDMRERRRLEDLREKARIEAERLADARGEFLANMSHEIRTPMNAIVGMTELCLGTKLSNKQQNYLTKIQGASNSLLRIINDILDFSKIESGKLEIEQVPFDFDQILDDLGALFSEKAGAKSIELIFDVDNSVNQALVGDPLRIEQILINLIGNAIKFSSRGSILVRARAESPGGTSARLHIEVIDEGIGLSAEQQARLFNAFTQADTSTTRHYGGTGLGLAICKRLVELMGGSIRVHSALGQGSKFSFTIGLKLDSTRVSRVTNMAQQLTPFAKRPVLIVDDNPLCRAAIAAQLGQLGITAEACASGGEALMTLARADTPDYLAVLVGLDPTAFNPATLVERMKARWIDSLVPPIIQLTSHKQNQQSEADSDVIDAALPKPTSTSRLFSAIAPFIGLQPSANLSQEACVGQEFSWLSGLEVLLVDDVALNQEVVRDMLEGAGIRVRTANNGREAIEAIASELPDCVLMDCQMPVMDGYAATRKLREDERYRELPIIALTANALSSARELCREAGMDGYITKPVRSCDLFATLIAHLPERAANAPVIAESEASKPECPTLFAGLPGIDSQQGLRYANGKPLLYRKLLVLFLESHGRDFEFAFRSELESGEWEAITRHAHSLKSSARMIGANQLADIAKALEEACHAQQREIVGPLLIRLLRELNSVCTGLSSLTAVHAD